MWDGMKAKIWQSCIEIKAFNELTVNIYKSITG